MINNILNREDNPPQDYYVYLLLDDSGPACLADLNLPGMPFYLGKGKNKRAFDHEREAKHLPLRGNIHKLSTIRNLWQRNSAPIVFIIKDGLSSDAAFDLEGKYGKLLGYRFDESGPLTNLIETGIKSPILHGERNPFYGRRHTQKTLDLISQASKRWHSTLSELDKKKLNDKRRDAMKGRPVPRELIEYRLTQQYGMDYLEKRAIRIAELKKSKEEKRLLRESKNLELAIARKNKKDHIQFLRDNGLLLAGSRNPMFGKGYLLEGAKNGRSKKLIITLDHYVFFVNGNYDNFGRLFKSTFNCVNPLRSTAFKIKHNVTITEIDEFPSIPDAIVFMDATSFTPLLGENYEKFKNSKN